MAPPDLTSLTINGLTDPQIKRLLEWFNATKSPVKLNTAEIDPAAARKMLQSEASAGNLTIADVSVALAPAQPPPNYASQEPMSLPQPSLDAFRGGNAPAPEPKAQAAPTVQTPVDPFSMDAPASTQTAGFANSLPKPVDTSNYIRNKMNPIVQGGGSNLDKANKLAALAGELQAGMNYDDNGMSNPGDVEALNMALKLSDQYASLAQMEASTAASRQSAANAAAQIAMMQEQLAEQRRQFDATMSYNKERDVVKDQQWQQNYNVSVEGERNRLQEALAQIQMSGANTMGQTYATAQGQSLQAMRSAVPADKPYVPGLEPGGGWATINNKLGLPFSPTPMPMQKFDPNVAPGIVNDLVNKAMQQAQDKLGAADKRMAGMLK